MRARKETSRRDLVAHFQIYESRKIALAAGDMIRVTQNGFTKDKAATQQRRIETGERFHEERRHQID
jgi:hypothetical protein